MTKNLETADTLAKLVLAVTVIITFLAGIIAGPFAILLLVISVFILVLHVLRILLRKTSSAKKE